MAARIVYLSMGSNVGDREENLRAAIEALADAGVRVKRVSSIYEMEPLDYVEQPWFLNCVMKGETELEAAELLRALRGIEAQMGSRKLIAKGPLARNARPVPRQISGRPQNQWLTPMFPAQI